MIWIILKWLICIWPFCGLIGFSLYMTNKDSRPTKFYLIPLAFVIHLCMGFISLFYGYVCYSSRMKILKNKVG